MLTTITHHNLKLSLRFDHDPFNVAEAQTLVRKRAEAVKLYNGFDFK